MSSGLTTAPAPASRALGEGRGPRARPLAHPGEDAGALVLEGDVIYELGDYDRLADPGPSEEADLAALQDWAHKVYDLDAGREHLLRGTQARERRGRAVYGPGIVRPLYRAPLVYRLAAHVPHAAPTRRARPPPGGGRR